MKTKFSPMSTWNLQRCQRGTVISGHDKLSELVLAHLSTNEPVILQPSKERLPFQWQSEQQLAFQRIKDVISKAPDLAC